MAENTTIIALIEKAKTSAAAGNTVGECTNLDEIDSKRFPVTYNVPVLIRFLVFQTEQLEQKISSVTKYINDLSPNDSQRLVLCDEIRWLQEQTNCLRNFVDSLLTEQMLLLGVEPFFDYIIFKDWTFSGMTQEECAAEEDRIALLDGEVPEHPEDKTSLLH
jgi:hypothetical protein